MPTEPNPPEVFTSRYVYDLGKPFEIKAIMESDGCDEETAEIQYALGRREVYKKILHNFTGRKGDIIDFYIEQMKRGGNYAN